MNRENLKKRLRQNLENHMKNRTRVPNSISRVRQVSRIENSSSKNRDNMRKAKVMQLY